MERMTTVPVMTALSLLAALAASSKGNPEAGKKIYLESCQSCHGPTGKGESDMAAYLTPPPSNSDRQGYAGKDRSRATKDYS